ncbi:hypothetical protein HAX54_041413 [Datura stramonium]|uniref:Uncharacterized protein n=1 Tax=Datura stramonium TaxID=4076 RepID=A0ABS8VQS9_DATST|nr:hypothetical protein [Datura stramonium]
MVTRVSPEITEGGPVVIVVSGVVATGGWSDGERWEMTDLRCLEVEGEEEGCCCSPVPAAGNSEERGKRMGREDGEKVGRGLLATVRERNGEGGCRIWVMRLPAVVIRGVDGFSMSYQSLWRFAGKWWVRLVGQ